MYVTRGGKGGHVSENGDNFGRPLTKMNVYLFKYFTDDTTGFFSSYVTYKGDWQVYSVGLNNNAVEAVEYIALKPN
jgi:hypothetical protein